MSSWVRVEERVSRRLLVKPRGVGVITSVIFFLGGLFLLLWIGFGGGGFGLVFGSNLRRGGGLGVVCAVFEEL